MDKTRTWISVLGACAVLFAATQVNAALIYKRDFRVTDYGYVYAPQGRATLLWGARAQRGNTVVGEGGNLIEAPIVDGHLEMELPSLDGEFVGMLIVEADHDEGTYFTPHVEILAMRDVLPDVTPDVVFLDHESITMLQGLDEYLYVNSGALAIGGLEIESASLGAVSHASGGFLSHRTARTFAPKGTQFDAITPKGGSSQVPEPGLGGIYVQLPQTDTNLTLSFEPYLLGSGYQDGSVNKFAVYDLPSATMLATGWAVGTHDIEAPDGTDEIVVVLYKGWASVSVPFSPGNNRVFASSGSTSHSNPGYISASRASTVQSQTVTQSASLVFAPFSPGTNAATTASFEIGDSPSAPQANECVQIADWSDVGVCDSSMTSETKIFVTGGTENCFDTNADGKWDPPPLAMTPNETTTVAISTGSQESKSGTVSVGASVSGGVLVTATVEHHVSAAIAKTNTQGETTSITVVSGWVGLVDANTVTVHTCTWECMLPGGGIISYSESTGDVKISHVACNIAFP